jgi:hypothetical protein
VSSALRFVGGLAVKTIVSLLVALSVLAGISAPAGAFAAKRFLEQQARAAH